MPAPDGRFRLLILGGTGEAAALARAADARWGEGIDMVSALAGRLERRPDVPGRLRLGGFGGTAGLAGYLAEEAVDALVDATHPFAAVISAHAEAAASHARVPRLVLRRAPWEAGPGDDWRPVRDLAAAARLIPGLGRRAFLTTGIGGLDAFAALPDTWFLVRLMAPPQVAPPLPRHALVIGRPPYRLEEESRLLRDHRIAVTVTKNSGGTATEAKLAAAREAGIPVVMVERPPAPGGETVAGVEAAIAWIAAVRGS